jgi:hypothetical protein
MTQAVPILAVGFVTWGFALAGVAAMAIPIIIHILNRRRYKKHESMVFQILDPTEVEFPFEDVTLFKGLEQMGDLLTEPRSLREGYLEQLNGFTDELKKMCRGMHIDFTRMNSGEPLDVSLSSFLATRSASMK